MHLEDRGCGHSAYNLLMSIMSSTMPEEDDKEYKLDWIRISNVKIYINKNNNKYKIEYKLD